MSVYIKTEIPDEDELSTDLEESNLRNATFVNFEPVFVKQEKDTENINIIQEKSLTTNINNTENESSKFIRVRNDVYQNANETLGTNESFNDSGYGNDTELNISSNQETFNLNLDENYSEARGGRYLICAAKDCRNNNNVRKDLYYFKFPRDPTMCAEWIKRCKRIDLIGKKPDFCHIHYRLCNIHFELSMFANGKLLSTAVPTLFPIENITPQYENNKTSLENEPPPNPIFSNKSLVHRNFKCHVCQKGFTTNYSLMLHVRIHSGERPYECTQCNKNFHQVANLRTHMLTHTQEKKFECLVCKKRFSQRGHLNKHEQIHEREKLLKSYREFLKKNQSILMDEGKKEDSGEVNELNGGIKKEVDDLEDNVSCDVVVKVELEEKDDENEYDSVSSEESESAFPVPTEQNSDINFSEQHSGKNVKESAFKCKVCHKCYVNDYSLKVHERIHTGIRPYKCHLCKKDFYQSSNLKTHIAKHNSNKKFQCKVCNKRFMFDFDLKHHETCHDKEKALECVVCHKTFSHRGNLLKHEKIHTGVKRFACPQCDKQFYDGSDLRKHLVVHSDEKPYECQVCNKKFSRHSYLKGHMSVHTNDQSFQCDECFKVFSTRSLLRRHQQRHKAREIGIKPYYCDVCDLYFSQTCSLKKHRKTPKHIQLLENKKDENSIDSKSLNSDSKSMTSLIINKTTENSKICSNPTTSSFKNLEFSLALSQAMKTNIIASNKNSTNSLFQNLGVKITDYTESKSKSLPKLFSSSSNIIMISDKRKLNIERSSLLSSGVDIISTSMLSEKIEDFSPPVTNKIGECIKYFPSGVEIYKL